MRSAFVVISVRVGDRVKNVLLSNRRGVFLFLDERIWKLKVILQESSGSGEGVAALSEK